MAIPLSKNVSWRGGRFHEIESEIVKILVDRGSRLFRSPREPIQFTDEPSANDLVNDLEQYPHAFVLGCVMNRQLPFRKVWRIPHEFKVALKNDFSMARLARLSISETGRIMTGPPRLHRFPEMMAALFHAAVARIRTVYQDDASRIWSGSPPSAAVVYRFLEFDGVGAKIATMAANALAREFKIPLADHYSIDVSVDIHVRRVFGRLGLTAFEASLEEIVYKARALSPEYPGIFDYPCWEIGRNWCHAKNPACHVCPMNAVCPTAAGLAGTAPTGESEAHPSLRLPDL
jgi:endonuclease-3